MSKDEVDKPRRQFLVAATSAVGSVGVAFAATPFVASWMPSAKAKAAGAPVEVDVSRMLPGQLVIISWRGKPVWLVRRTKAMLATLTENDDSLRDPGSDVAQQPDYAKNTHRSIKPEFLVLIGVCTHLGCSPKYKPNLGELGPNWPGGFYCPCHGSTFDMAGRVYKGVPAPINLEVPPYHFVNDTHLIVGVDGTS